MNKYNLLLIFHSFVLILFFFLFVFIICLSIITSCFVDCCIIIIPCGIGNIDPPSYIKQKQNFPHLLKQSNGLSDLYYWLYSRSLCRLRLGNS